MSPIEQEKETCKKEPGILVAGFLEEGLVVSRLDADSKDDRKLNFSELLLLRACYRLLGVKPTLYQKTHLKKKKGKAAGVQKKDRLQAFHSAPIICRTLKVMSRCVDRPAFKYTQSLVYQRRGGSANKNVFWKIGNYCKIRLE